MTAYISTARDGNAWRWSVVRTIPTGADVVARSHRAYPDEETCRRDAARISRYLCHADVAQNDDGSWRWAARAEDGTTVVQSPQFADAAQCGHDLASVRLEARGATSPATAYVVRARNADPALDD